MKKPASMQALVEDFLKEIVNILLEGKYGVKLVLSNGIIASKKNMCF